MEIDSGREHLFSARFACPICSYSLPELEPRLFSFNNPMGACPRCDGLGSISFFDPKRVVALSASRASRRGRSRAGTGATSSTSRCCEASAAHFGFDLETPVRQAAQTRTGRGAVRLRARQDPLHLRRRARPRTQTREHAFEGIIPNLERRYKETDSLAVREELAKYLNSRACPECSGTRCAARRATCSSASRPSTASARMPLKHGAGRSSRDLELSGAKLAIAEKIVAEIVNRLQFLNNVGLDYLSLDRSAETLSGGEAQRIRLASQIGSGLTGVMYVLDEPSIGLHQRDNDRLLVHA